MVTGTTFEQTEAHMDNSVTACACKCSSMQVSTAGWLPTSSQSSPTAGETTPNSRAEKR